MTDEEGQLDNLIADYLQQIDAGADVDVNQFISGYSDEIQSAFRDYLRLEEELYRLNAFGGIDQGTSTVTQGSTSTSGELLSDEDVGGYRLLNAISHGGMGVVYVGQNAQSGMLVAIKLLRRAIRNVQTYRLRLERESRAIAALNHPHVVRPIASGVDEGSTYLAMQLIDGVGFDRVIQYWRQQIGDDSDVATQKAPTTIVKTPVTQSEVASCAAYFEQDRLKKIAERLANIADALHVAHESGIVHRDVKPSNILVDVHGDIWLTDFGLASMGEDEIELTETGDVLGTPAYMSPEQASGQSGDINRATDVYSLGVTLYELCTLRKPYLGTRQKIIHDVLSGRFVRPSRVRPEIPTQLEAIICHAMELNPRDRYATAKEFASDLRQYVDRGRVRARLRNRIQGALRWCERNPLTFTVAIAGCVMAVMVAFSVQLVNSWSLSSLNSQLNSVNEQLLGANRDLDASQSRLKRELYVANIRSAFEAFHDQDLTAIQLLLAPYQGADADVPRSVPQRMLEALIEPPKSLVLTRHTDFATQFVISDDASFLLSVGHDGQVIKANFDGEQLQRFTIGGKLDSIAIDKDSQLFLTGKNIPVGENLVDFYRMDNGEHQQKGSRPWYGIEEVAVSPSGRWFAASERYHSVFVFDKEGKQRAKWTTDTRNESLEFIDDDHLLGICQAGKDDRRLYLYNIDSEDKEEISSEVESFALARDSDGEPSYVVSAGTNDLRVVRWSDKKQTVHVADMPSRIRCVDVSPDDGLIVAGCDDGTVYLWEVDCDQEKPLPQARIVEISDQRITDIELLPGDFRGGKVRLGSNRFAELGIQLITSSEDGTVQLHHLPARNPVDVVGLSDGSRGTTEEPFRDPLRSDLLYLPFANGELVRLDLTTLSIDTVFRHDKTIVHGICADNKIYFADENAIVEINCDGEASPRTFPSPLKAQRCRWMLKLDQQLYVLYSSSLVSIDLGDGGKQTVHNLPYDEAIGMVPTGDKKSPVRIYTHRAVLELDAGGQIETTELSESIKEGSTHVQYSNDQKKRAIAKLSDQIEVFDSENGIKSVLAGHLQGITDVEFVEDEDTLMSVAHDGTLRFWSLETAREYGRLDMFDFGAHHVFYFRDQSLIATVSYRGWVRVWRLAPASEVGEP
ncbi:hypothetical protein DTL21_27635 [Bremerella cremea]|uniref:Protein kinase domain-containing protein n=1 Tax=Blastopirellula marina TaxID=124 RepID=A0A2S8FCE0_9BACT|nr:MULTISPECIES: serine/threonine-protein kinase [Pirellulaceae]PQO29809.1 hypothetical protein C5Y83_27590 [Blastopirellula marina]RCS43111.1 hypothetical protein DTL21_27635 [Bremerella cremea]